MLIQTMPARRRRRRRFDAVECLFSIAPLPDPEPLALRAKPTECDSCPLKYAPSPGERQGLATRSPFRSTHWGVGESLVAPYTRGECVRVLWITMRKQSWIGPAARRLVGQNPLLMMASVLHEGVPAQRTNNQIPTCRAEGEEIQAEQVNVYGCAKAVVRYRALGRGGECVCVQVHYVPTVRDTVVAQHDLGRGRGAAGGEHRLQKAPHERHVDVPQLGSGGVRSPRHVTNWVAFNS